MPPQDPRSVRRLRWTATLVLVLLVVGWSVWAVATGAAPLWLGVASITVSALAGALSLAGLGESPERPEDGTRPEGPDAVETDESPSVVPAAVAESATLSALWRRGRESGRDEIGRAVDGLQEGGARSVAGLREALAAERVEGAVTCARSLAGVASMLDRDVLEGLCRDLARDLEAAGGVPDDAAARVVEIEAALDAAVAELRRITKPNGRDARSRGRTQCAPTAEEPRQDPPSGC